MVLQTVINSLVVVVVGILVTWLTRTQITDLKEDLKDDVRDVRADLRDLRTEVVSLRSDLTQVALAVGVQPRPRRSN